MGSWHGCLVPNTHRRRRRDSTVELSRVGGVNTVPVGSRDPVYNFLCFELLSLVTSDVKMTSLLKKLSISIKIHGVKPLCSVSKLSTESVGSRREPVANSQRRRDATCIGH